MAVYSTIYTTGFIELCDERRPARALGRWSDVWARFPAENAAHISSEASTGNPATDKQNPHPAEEPRSEDHD